MNDKNEEIMEEFSEEQSEKKREFKVNTVQDRHHGKLKPIDYVFYAVNGLIMLTVCVVTLYPVLNTLAISFNDGVDAVLAKPLFADILRREVYKIWFESESMDKIAENTVTAPAEEILAGRRVLMAEDVEQNAEILADLLELEEIESEHARNGKEAVQMFSDSEEGYYDAVLMDVRMPEMDGLTAARTIRALERPDAKTIPIIAMTANVFDEDIERSMQVGMNAHLSKPIEPEKMYETMARLISDADKYNTV